MKGQILDFSIQSNTGVISGDDQNRYQFSGSDWKGQSHPARGQFVDFEIRGLGQAANIYQISVPSALGTQYGQKSRIAAAILAFFLFCWTFIPSIVAFIEFIIYLCTSDEDFARKYG